MDLFDFAIVGGSIIILVLVADILLEYMIVVGKRNKNKARKYFDNLLPGIVGGLIVATAPIFSNILFDPRQNGDIIYSITNTMPLFLITFIFIVVAILWGLKYYIGK